MKQSFTLKAVALGLAAVATLGASAVRPQKLANSETLSKIAHPLFNGEKSARSTVAVTPISQKLAKQELLQIRPVVEKLDLTAQNASRAIDPYGKWEDAGTLEYTFTQLYNNEFISESAKVKSYPYQKRVHAQNDQQFQIKVSNWGAFTEEESGVQGGLPGSELILTITPAQTTSGKTVGVVTTDKQGVNLGWPVNFPTSDNSQLLVDMYYYDAYTYVSNLAAMNTGISQSTVNKYYGTSQYDYGSGKFEIFCSYAGESGTENINYGLEWGDFDQTTEQYTRMWYDTIQLSGKFYNYDATVNGGYFYRNPGETTGHYKVHYDINDNVVGVVKLIKGSISDQTTLNNEFNAMLDALDAPTANMAVFTNEEGWAELLVDPYEDGAYSLLFGYSDGIEDANKQINFKGGAIGEYLEGAEYVLDGFANYQDVAVPAFFSCILKPGYTITDLGLPADYKTNCSVEKSEKETGAYRLRAPYAQYPYEALDGLDYEQSLDYLYYNVSDPSKVVIDFSLTGLSLNLGESASDAMYVGLGSVSAIFDTAQMGIDNIYGTFADNKITMPSTSYVHTFQFTDQNGQPAPEDKTMTGILGCVLNYQYKLGDFAGATNPTDFLIETGVVDAIENVEASADVNAPVEYYNLQGQKVVNPAAGQLVIKKQGSKVTKMIAQ